jgi:hypothetical protein
LSAKVSTLEEGLSPPLSEGERRKEVSAIAAKKSAAQEKIDLIVSDMGAHSAELSNLEARRLAVETEIASSDQVHAESVPRVQHSISLYATISGIRWDYSKDSLIAGVVNTSTEVRDFELDPSTMNRFEITQRLWEMIDPL